MMNAADRRGAWRAMPGGDSALGLLAHDLRTPISCICGAAQLALESALEDERTRDCLREILSAARAMEAITGELLGDEKERAVFSGGELEVALRALLDRQAAQRGVTLTMDLHALEGVQCCADFTALCRVLMNLLGNAVKYTPGGGHVALTARLTRGECGMFALFRVADDGVGMKDGFMRRIFRPYARARETASIEGHGLGLASVRRLVDRMDGTIEVESRWGKGTVFTVRVPLEEAPRPVQNGTGPLASNAGQAARVAQAQPVVFAGSKAALAQTARGPDAHPLAARHILLAEDNPMGASILAARLEAQGARVTLARNGEEAARLFAEAEPGTYGAVLVDLHMPVLDGTGAARAIRALPGESARRVPVIALTAGCTGAEEREALRAGADACLPKPVDIAALCAALDTRR